MLLFNIHNYDDFKFLFGLETHGNGVKSRKNKILLQHLKNPALIKWCREHDDWSLLRIRNMADLKQKVLNAVQESGKQDEQLQNDPSMTAGDLFYMYQTNYPKLRLEDFERIVEEYHLLYCDEEDIFTPKFKSNGNQKDDPEILGFTG